MRWLHDLDEDAPTDIGVPDAVAVLDADGELVGWDESAVHAYHAERGEPCDDECAKCAHVTPWI